MSLRINHNVAAINSWRNLKATDEAMGKTLERLSSGYKINRAGDSPANLVISEQMRGQIKSMEQATANSEIAIAMVQTAEASLNEVNSVLIGMRQLALHAANEGANDDKMLAADQAEMSNALLTIDRMSRSASFGTRKLLNGSNGISGIGVGNGIEFVRGDVVSRSSPAEGYEVDINAIATKARIEGERSLSQEEIEMGGVEITLQEGGSNFVYSTKVGETMQTLLKNLEQLVTQNNLKLEVGLTEDKRLFIEHQEFGSEPSFGVVSNVGGVLAAEADLLEGGIQGSDVEGTIGGELAYGDGQYLTAAKNTKADGTVIKFAGGLKVEAQVGETGLPLLDDQGVPLPPKKGIEGFVQINNNSLAFQVGPNQGETAWINLPNLNTHVMARRVQNDSGFVSLAELDVTTAQGAQDALKMIDQSIYEITAARGDLGAFQKNTLESNLNNLRYASENLINAESVIRDTDMAKEMSNFTKQQILLASGTAMLGQANQTPKAVLSLLNGK